MQSYTPGSVIGAEALRASDSAALKGLLRQIGFGGVLVGAIQCPATGELRPLVLQSGQSFILRLLPANFAGAPQTAHRFGQFMTQLGALTRCGVLEGRLWTARAYYPVLLEELVANRAFDGRHFAPLLREVLHTLRLFQEVGLCHGHISASNIALDALQQGDRAVTLLDGGYLPLNPGAREIFKRFDPAGLAPEVREHARFGIKADLYSFGVLARGLARLSTGVKISTIQEAVLQACCESDPVRRPELRDVEEAFFPEQALIRGGSATLQAKIPAGGSGGVGSGRLISAKPGPLRAQPDRDAGRAAARLDFQRTIENNASPSRAAANISTGSSERNVADSGSFKAVAQTAEQSSLQSKAESALRVPKAGNAALLYTLLALLCAFLLWQYSSGRLGGGASQQADWGQLWDSHQPSDMRSVAEAAVVNGERDAQRAIERGVMLGAEAPQVNSRYLRMALNSLWEAELGAEDRRLALYLGLIELLPNQPEDLIPLEEAYPGIAVALAAAAPPKQAPRALDQVALEQAATLPAPFGAAFKALRDLGVTNLAELPAIAMSHLLFGESSVEVLSDYFGALPDPNKQIGLLSAILPLARLNSALADMCYANLAYDHGVLGSARSWFEADQTAVWVKTPRLQILSIITGNVPVAGLGFEQLADLLSFPVPKVRRDALEGITKMEGGKELAPVLHLLSSEYNHLSRFQSVSLLLALQIKGEKGEAYISTWFKSAPAPEMVANLLLARADLKQDDFFNLEAARFLINANWKPALDYVKAFMRHPEAMARAYAVSRLNISDPEQRALLEAMAVVEPSARIRDQIKKRLAP